MNGKRAMNIAKELKGMTVLRTDTGDRMGEISDIIIHPVEGRMLGLILRSPEGRERFLTVRDFFVGKDAVMTRKGARFIEEEVGALPSGVPAVGEIVGTNVVTEDGKLLGRVSEVYLLPHTSRTVYRVTESTLQRYLGGGFYIAGDLPDAYSHDGIRLIVPAETRDRFAATTVDEAFGGPGREAREEAVL